MNVMASCSGYANEVKQLFTRLHERALFQSSETSGRQQILDDNIANMIDLHTQYVAW